MFLIFHSLLHTFHILGYPSVSLSHLMKVKKHAAKLQDRAEEIELELSHSFQPAEVYVCCVCMSVCALLSHADWIAAL